MTVSVKCIHMYIGNMAAVNNTFMALCYHRLTKLVISAGLRKKGVYMKKILYIRRNI